MGVVDNATVESESKPGTHGSSAHSAGHPAPHAKSPIAGFLDFFELFLGCVLLCFAIIVLVLGQNYVQKDMDDRAKGAQTAQWTVTWVIMMVVFGSMPLVEIIKKLTPKKSSAHGHGHGHADVHPDLEDNPKPAPLTKRFSVDGTLGMHGKYGKRNVNDIIKQIEDDKAMKRQLRLRKKPGEVKRSYWDMLDIRVNPEGPLKRSWDLLIVTLVLMLLVMIPLETFVDWWSPYYDITLGGHKHKFYYFISYFMDIVFWVDVWLNFTSAFSHGAHVVHDKMEIIKHYMVGNPLTQNTGWFWVDLIGGIPFELIAGGFIAKKDRKSIKILKWLKLPKLLRAGRLQKLMGKYVSFAMFLQHMALAVVFLHVFACAYLGHYGYETFGLDSNGHEYFYAQDTGGHLYYSAKVCNIRNLYNFKDSFSSYGYYGSSSYGEGDSSYSSYYSRRNLGGSYDAPSFYEVDAPVDEDCLSTWDAYVEAIASIMSMIVGGTATVLGVPDNEMGSYNTPRTGCYPKGGDDGSYYGGSYYDSSSNSSYGDSPSASPTLDPTSTYYGYPESEYDEKCETHGFTGAGLRCLCVPIGTLIFWLLQADIVVVMFNSTNAYSRQREGVTKALAEIDYFGFPDELSDSIKAALNVRWKDPLPSECSLIKDKALGEAIQKEVVLHFHGAQMHDEVLFSGAPTNCVAMAAFALKTNIVAAYHYVYRRGEIGTSCFLLAKGECVLLHNDNTISTELPVGDMFGEMAVISDEVHYREENAFALTNCSLETFTVESFLEIAEKFPVLKENSKVLNHLMRQDPRNFRSLWDRFRDTLNSRFTEVQTSHEELMVKLPGHSDGHEHGGEDEDHGDHHSEEEMPYIPDWVFRHKDYIMAREALCQDVYNGTFVGKSVNAELELSSVGSAGSVAAAM